MRSRIEIEIDAPARHVFDMARDVRKWPHLLPHYKNVTVMSHDGDEIVATFNAIRAMGPLEVPVAWRSRTWSESGDPTELRLRFVHVRGVTRGMEVTWRIVPRGAACSVAIEHDFERPLPLLGRDALPRLIDQLFVRPIAGRTLATFKALAEAS